MPIDLNKPGEKKKLIWAGVLGFVAIVFLWWTFFGFGSSSKPASTRPTTTTAQATQPGLSGTRTSSSASQSDTTE
ncbi:MAG TPA: hypothetical protein VF251_07305, partial [Pyrinomonadaceae bacterium]